MKKLFLCALLALTTNLVTLHANNFYFGGFGGANWIEDEESHFDFSYKTGYLLGGNLGYRWHCSCWRLEGEFSYKKNRIRHLEAKHLSVKTQGHQSYWAGMANIYYDFLFPNTWVTPFIGAGVGWYQERIEVEKHKLHAEHKNSKMAWQILAGMAYEVNSCYSVNIMYRLFKPEEKFYNHGATMGVNYFF